MRTRPIVDPAPPAWTFPGCEVTALDSGLRLVLVDLPGQHVLSIRTIVPMNLVDEPADTEGIFTVMSRVLDEGTASHSPTEFAELVERAGIALGAGVSDGGLSVDMDVPSGYAAAALDLLTELLSEPVFPGAEVRRAVAARLTEIDHADAHASSRAAKEFLATAVDPSHRASRPTGGERAGVRAVTSDALRREHARRVGPRGATVVIAGHLAGTDVASLASRALQRWRADGQVSPTPWRPPPSAPTAGRIVLVDRPGSVQAEIHVGWPGPDRHVDGGWAPYPAAAWLLAGSPGARVDAVLREEKGYTYGIRGAYRSRRRGGHVVVAGAVRGDVAVESLGLLHGILDRSADGFTDAEVASAVDFLSRTAPGRYATADTVADEVAALALHDLPWDFTSAYLAAVTRLDAEAVSAAHRRWLAPGMAARTSIVVGDAADLEPALRRRAQEAATRLDVVRSRPA